MKNSMYASRAATLAMSAMLALSITINPLTANEACAWKTKIFGKWVKGDDPKIPKLPPSLGIKIPTVEESVNSIGHSIDTNLKGLDRAIKRNSKTLAHIGRAAACWATWCVSEAYRAYKIEEQRKKLKEELRNYKERALADFARKNKQEQIDSLKGELERIDAQIVVHNEAFALSKLHLEIMTGLNVAFGTEIEYRKLLAKDGIAPAPLNESFRATSAQFEHDLKAGDAEAFDKLHAEIQKQAAATGTAVEDVMNDVIAFLSDETLAHLHMSFGETLKTSTKETVELQAELVKIQAERSQVANALKALTTPPAKPRPPKAKRLPHFDGFLNRHQRMVN